MTIVETVTHKLVATVRSDSMLLRTFALLGVVSLLAFCFLEYIRVVWRDNFELRAPGSNGAVVFHSSFDQGFRKVVFLVPASQCWINTELSIEPGESIKFTTSGKVHLALNLIKQEELAVIKWSKPDGSPFKKPEKDLGDRRNFLISQHRNDDNPDPLVGNLVGFLQADGIDLPDPGADNPRPIGTSKNKVFHIGHEHTITNETGHKANIWLSVNDIALDSSKAARQAYLGDSTVYVRNFLASQRLSLMSKTEQKRQADTIWSSHLKTWERIREAKQWDLYFNDNIGTYLVFIEKIAK
jgi:hypothetical protein